VPHILYILPYLEQGGTEKQALSLIKHFQHDNKVSLLAPDGASADQFKSQDIDYYAFPRLEQNLVGGIAQFRRGIQAINRSKPVDLVHVHAAHELILLTKLFLPRVPILFTVHGYHGDQSMVSYQLACWFVNWSAEASIAVCEAEQDILSKLGIDRSKLNLIYNGVDRPQLSAEKSQAFAHRFGLDRSEQIIIGTAARLTEAKGLTYLIQAFANLAKSNLRLRLVLAGSGELEHELKELARSLGMIDRIIFAGYVNDLPNLIELFDIFVLPSLQEACSLACVEAMAQHKAVIGTKVGGIPEQVIDGETGYSIEPKDVAALTLRLKHLIEDRELATQFGQNGYQKYKRDFTTEIMLTKTSKLYEKLIGLR